MTRAAVGVAVHAEPARFRATVEALRATVPPATLLLAVPDRADAETAAAVARSGLAPVPETGAAGGAASFNRLMAGTDAEVVVLLESGCVPAAGWLERLLAALDAHPRSGLAGPSTNRAWTEQGALPRCPGTAAGIAEAARRLERMHGTAARSTAPLYGLGDFCYAVRRAVWEEIGAADEGFGAGPCWEMEYSARAARAGWRGVWVPAAFVWRAPFTPRRARDERRLMEASRRRYQDRLCGLRLRGERAGYERHCRGDACEHFAPAGLIRLRVEPGAPPAPAPAPPPPRVPPPVPQAAPGEPPLVSCIMPTRGRPEYALRAIRYFQAQDWPRRELVILDDAGGALEGRLPADPRIRYHEVPAGTSIGAKRNRGVELARGEIVAQWDDDDWYAPGRLRAQAEPIAAGLADVTALRADLFLELDEWRFWRCSDALHRRLFVHDVHGGTLVYRRSLWEGGARYPAASLAEDAAFLTRALRRGARLLRVDRPGLFVYLRHGANAWKFACGRHVDPAGWTRADEPAELADDRGFYRALSPAARGEGGARPEPLVSCLMPTANRRAFVPRAIEHFLRQDHPHRELVIVDDGDDGVGDLVPADPRIRYHRAARSRTLGDKRNLACSLARGDLFAHWDDDDWMADDRLSRQVAALERTGAEVCGLATVRYFDPWAERAWEFRWPAAARPWVGGNTLLYRRAAWERRRFPALDVGEDTRWTSGQRSVAALRDPGWLAALVHAGNTSPKRTGSANWHPVPLDAVRGAMGGDWAFYAALAGSRAAA